MRGDLMEEPTAYINWMNIIEWEAGRQRRGWTRSVNRERTTLITVPQSTFNNNSQFKKFLTYYIIDFKLKKKLFNFLLQLFGQSTPKDDIRLVWLPMVPGCQC